MSKSKLLGLSLLSGLLFSLPWFKSFSGIIICFAFIPLLIIEDFFYKTKHINSVYTFINYSFISFLLWNIATTYWISNVTLIGAISAIMVNTTFMCIVLSLFHLTKRVLGNNIGNLSFIVYWIGFEYCYLNAEISWPWLNLGNAFAKNIYLIQWYEYTGALGGTLWVLCLNFFLFKIIKTRKFDLVKTSLYIIFFILPIFISIYIFNNYKEKENKCEIAIIQPNIDPFNDKFNKENEKDQIQTILNLAQDVVTPNTQYIITPETSLSNPVWEQNLRTNASIRQFSHFINIHPNVHFIIGLNSFVQYQANEKPSFTARFNKEQNFYYDAYNTALQIDSSLQFPIYHKSKLVIGVEKMPFVKYFSFLDKLSIKLGGISGSLGIQDSCKNFNHHSNKISIAPVICYESIYGEYVSKYVKKGANFIFIITNDGWFGNTIGHKQHFNYSKLRAIETRRSIARCANTGISAFINQRGETLEKTNWWTRKAIRQDLKPNTKITFYTQHGNYIGRIAIFLSIILGLYLLSKYLISVYNRNIS